jgi:L-fuconolactonase
VARCQTEANAFFAENPVSLWDGCELFRGIRVRDRKLEGTLDDHTFVSDLKLLADHDLSLDLVGGREILPFAERLAKEVPNLRIIIDHLAGVVVDGKAPPADWVTNMRSLAQRKNIYCKLLGLVEGTGRIDGSAPRDAEFYRPLLDAMREMFGPERLIYASNWPVSERFAPLATVQGIVAEYFHSHGRREGGKGLLADRQGGLPLDAAATIEAMTRIPIRNPPRRCRSR